VASLVAIDLLAFVSAMALVFSVSPTTEDVVGLGLSPWSRIACCLVIPLTMAFTGLYGRRYVRAKPALVVRAWVVSFAVATFLMLLLDPGAIGARPAAAWLLALPLSLAGRLAYDAVLAALFGDAGEDPPCLLLGVPAACREALPSLASLPPESRMSVVGVVVPPGETSLWDAGPGLPPVAGSYPDLAAAIQRAGAVQVLLAGHESLNGHLGPSWRRAGRSASRSRSWPHDLHLAGDGRRPRGRPGLPAVRGAAPPAGRGSYLLKKLADCSAAVAALIVLSPLLALVALLIKLTSPGPVLFADERVGIGQRPFRCFKFRTMVSGAAQAQATLEHLNEAGRGALQDPRRPPRRDARRPRAASPEPGRAAPALERAARRDEPDRPAAATLTGLRAHGRMASPATRGTARHDGSVAGQRAQRPGLRRHDAPGPAVHRNVVAQEGPAHRVAHRRHGVPLARRL
jgi:hypothetical protein